MKSITTRLSWLVAAVAVAAVAAGPVSGRPWQPPSCPPPVGTFAYCVNS